MELTRSSPPKRVISRTSEEAMNDRLEAQGGNTATTTELAPGI